MSVRRADLQTSVLAVHYDFLTRTGTLHMAPQCTTDMTGAIALFTAIDPDVQRIETIAGDHLDTAYVYTAGGWESRRS